MKKRICLTALAAIAIVVLNVSPVLADKVFHPAETLELEIIHPANIPDINETFWQNITQTIEEKITAASIKLPPKPESGVKDKSTAFDRLTVYVDILKIEDQKKIVFHSAAFFSKKMPLQRIILWKDQSPLKITETKIAHAEIEKNILSQVDMFLKICIASPAPIATKDASGEAEQGKFVSSKNSQIFHKIDCSSAKRIKSENKILYDNRQQAIDAGKRPCKKCEP